MKYGGQNAVMLILSQGFAFNAQTRQPRGYTNDHRLDRIARPRGDMLVFANEIFDAANKTRIGSDQGYCVRTVVGKSWECFWTLTLEAGQITIEGPFMDEGDSLMAVTGGTGKYAGAKGSMKLHPRDPTPTGYDFTYDLL
jgi:hypothetical protein